MSAETHALQQQVQAAYQAARARENAPWQILDSRWNVTRHRIGQSRQRQCPVNSAEDRDAAAREQQWLEDALAEFRRWRDMPADRMAAAAHTAMTPTQEPASADQTARVLFDGLHARGIRIEVGHKDRISVCPARLLTDADKAQLTTLRVEIATIWRQRNDVWTVG
ncbi:hypothetical protein [Tanticharoenia sakaeratensis]|uniref:Uncharacterized protein n=1 Tax=Tanticharoenia sakaeratensis NBRC 103193 TaxID=1231623 RepID=A0A0D6MP69_9PROT|nr:hypothetical protein [Tanticharoenia sakaeratensis]GAN55469.1 hypothetical protein Tasa_048_094 [Tanticharoenia sakaeratensis NBRC 103193]GBQ21990.1 hypothetical protein AA103193_1917 [Tanticharoenia sakaeratensis NBRC 103193]